MIRLLLLSLVLACTLCGTARAEGEEYQLVTDLKAGKIRQLAALDRFNERIAAVGRRCEVMEIQQFEREAEQFKAYFASLGDDSQIDVFDIPMAMDRFKATCDSQTVKWSMRGWIETCQLKEARIMIDRLKALAENYERQARNARGANQFSTVDAALATRTAEKARKDYTEGREIYDRELAKCEKKPKEEQQQQQQVEEVEVGDARDGCPTGQAADCNRWAPLLGRWTSRRHGGAIETTLEADGTLTGRIVATNKIMENNGFTAGMTVLRGWVPKGGNLTWLISANDGEYFIAAQPDRKPGEMYGDPKWTKSGVFMIETKDPGRLQIPATLENRISSYDPWVRTGSGPQGSTDMRTIPTRAGGRIDYADSSAPLPEIRLSDGDTVTVPSDSIEVKDRGPQG